MSHGRVMGQIVPDQNSRKRNFHSDQIYQIQLQMVTILEKMPHFFDWHHLPQKCSYHLRHLHNLKLLARNSLVEHHQVYLLIYVKYHHFTTISIICFLHVHKFPSIRWLKLWILTAALTACLLSIVRVISFHMTMFLYSFKTMRINYEVEVSK